MEAYKILMPTDFTVKSLILVRKALELTGDKTLNITLVHGIVLPSSITELLFYSKYKVMQKLSDPAFQEACELLKNRYSDRIQTIAGDVITSRNQSYFSGYLQANAIEEIFIPENLVLDFKRKDSFDVMPLFNKAKIKRTTVRFTQETNTNSEVSKVSDLFFHDKIGDIYTA